MIVYVYPGPLRNDPICRILLHGLKRPTRYILFAIFVLQFRNDEVFHYKNVMSVNKYSLHGFFEYLSNRDKLPSEHSKFQNSTAVWVI